MTLPTPDELLHAARAGRLDALGDERDALAAAVHAFAERGDGAAALELASLTWRLWFSRGEVEQGSEVVAIALSAPGAEAPSRDRVRLLYADGLFAFRAGDQERSRLRNEEALRLARSVADARGECDALTGLARVELREGRYARVVELAREARRRAQAENDRGVEAAPLHLEAAGTRLGGDYVRARELYVESLELNRSLGNDGWVAMELHNLGWVDLHLNEIDSAEERFRERDAHDLDADAYGRAWRDLNWAAVAAARGDTAEAAARLGAGEQALRALGLALDPDDRFELDWLRDAVVGGSGSGGS